MGGKRSRVAILGGLLHRIGNYDPTTFETSFDDRLIMQKTIYLMQVFGLNIGYKYNWYLKGPYSPGLTKDAYQLRSEYDELPSLKYVSEDKDRKFNEFIRFIQEHQTDPKWLEAVASIVFLWKRHLHWSQEKIWTATKNKMKSLKKSEFISFWNTLVEKDLIGER